MNNKKYNPEDYKDVEFITLGDGPVRIQFAKPANLSVKQKFLVLCWKASSHGIRAWLK
jgi:hypothetical protein